MLATKGRTKSRMPRGVTSLRWHDDECSKENMNLSLIDNHEDLYGTSVVLFKYDWYTVEKYTYGLTYVFFNKNCSLEEPFVLVSLVHQCFYVQDPYDQDRHYVMRTILRDQFNISNQVESNDSESYKNKSSEQYNSEVVLIRNYILETIIDKDAEGFLAEQHDVEHGNMSENESKAVYEEEYEEEFANDSEKEPDVDFEDEP
ncbi:hypothetical protein FXO38_32568 [Capsicum annuum]|uniref:Uncharacterized protein n=1 Tax=Capsicum annuum TaxID=4072 RepID=A0A2G2ZPT6_CAPAN|nr:hypothetical protein FXO38_32568 [Capsicum annuum]KAF3620772.1 hypothetical protein FXO37_33107 [Capsicum annuum]PHT83957.1 hypothetical protein T459_12400 [Capsicum annuum]